jgi:hypothetical protein
MQTTNSLPLCAITALWLVHGALVAEEGQVQQVGEASDPQQAAQVAGEEQETQEAPERSLFPPDQIEQLVAPIALYPDALIAQMLMAATYPLDIVQAARWTRDQKDLEGEALEKAAEEQPWDPSVKTLVFFPEVLAYMSDNLDWTQDLGDAMLGQQDEVMDTIQRLRNDAQDAGALQTTEQQRVVTEGDTIVVQPADPKVVYVPTYDPATVYGQTAPPATTYYPATYTTPVVTTSSSSSSDSWINFGSGALVGGLLTAAILWDRNDTNIYYGGRGRYGGGGYWGSPSYWKGGWKQPVNIDRNVNVSRGDVNINREIKKWEHNPVNRGGVRYRDNSTTQRFANVSRDRNIDRDLARGRDPDRQRPDVDNRPGKGNGDRPRPGGRDRSGLGEGNRPGGGSGRRPDDRPGKRPAERPTKRGATREAARPAKPAPKPGTKPAERRAAKPAKKPAAKPAQRAAAKPAKRPATRTAQRPARSGGGKSSAFKKDHGTPARAASQRGASSRGGGARRGGGGHRGGGSARGGGRRR